MDFIKLAIDNVSRYGDTDIFPFPIENALFFDMPDKVKLLLEDVDKNFNQWLTEYPVDAIKTCVPVGYTGFRWATVIDPVWNIFLLYEVLKIAKEIENNRVSVEKECVFSYRMKMDEGTGKLFDVDINWRCFFSTALKIAETYNYIVRLIYLIFIIEYTTIG